MTWAVAILASALPVALPQGPGPTFHVANPSEVERREVVLASVPYPMGTLPAERELLWMVVRSEEQEACAPAIPLMRWRDGSVAVLQVQAPVILEPRAERTFSVEPMPESSRTPVLPAAVDSPLARPLPLHTELEDAWGRTWVARLEPDAGAGPDGLLRDTGLVRVTRYRSRHLRPLDDDGKASGDARAAEAQALLGLRAYLTVFGGERRGELTLLLDNVDLPGGDLGPVRFRGFALVSEGLELRFAPRFAQQNNLSEPELQAQGGFRQELLGPGRNIYLGDQTAKAFRFTLYWQDEGADEAELQRARAAAVPLRPLPDLEWVRHSRAFGAHGGPAPLATEYENGAGNLLDRWRRSSRFGPFGGFGDPEDAAVQGTARNGPSTLHNVLRWSSPAMMDPAEGMVLQQTLRPTAGRHIALPEDTEAWRQGMGPLARNVPHGFTPLDYEHYSVNLLFDWYWLTGDPLARDELERAGRGLRDVLAALPFRTSRGEGWCMQSGALIARATGDRALAGWLRDRFVDEVLPEMGKPGSGYAIRQPAHPQALGDDPFDAPWQMAALVHGLHALWGETGDPEVAAAAVRVAETMAGAGWVEGVGPKYFVSALDPSRYSMPVGFEPNAGTAWMELGAFVLAVELTAEPDLRQMFRSRVRFLLDPVLAPGVSAPRRVDLYANPWLQLALDRLENPK